MEFVPVGGDLVIDVLPDGSVYGIELLNTNGQLKGGKKKIKELIKKVTNGKFNTT